MPPAGDPERVSRLLHQYGDIEGGWKRMEAELKKGRKWRDPVGYLFSCCRSDRAGERLEGRLVYDSEGFAKPLKRKQTMAQRAEPLRGVGR